MFSFNNWEVDSIDLGSLQLLQLLQNTATTAAPVYVSAAAVLSVQFWFWFPALVNFLDILFDLMHNAQCLVYSSNSLCVPQLFFQLVGRLANKITAETRERLPYKMQQLVSEFLSRFCFFLRKFLSCGASYRTATHLASWKH